MDKLRLRFSKTGRAIYISHLDLMRTMQRSFLRAGYPLEYSKGFNPHALISILLPLSVGCSSLCEMMDFTLASEDGEGISAERLTQAMPEGLRALEIYPAEGKSRDIKWLEAEGRFEYDERPLNEMTERLKTFFGQDSIVISKKTKRGEGESDIAPAIKRIDFEAGDGFVKVRAVLSAQQPTLNPDNLAAALRQLAPEAAPDFACFTRLELYDENMHVFR